MLPNLYDFYVKKYVFELSMKPTKAVVKPIFQQDIEEEMAKNKPAKEFNLWQVFLNV